MFSYDSAVEFPRYQIACSSQGTTVQVLASALFLKDLFTDRNGPLYEFFEYLVVVEA